jgi:hypothetical protein
MAPLDIKLFRSEDEEDFKHLQTISDARFDSAQNVDNVRNADKE